MRILKVFFALLMSLVLCSCSNTSQMETGVEEFSGAVTISDEINAEDPIIAEPVSAIFRGESIVAPGYYPGVPDAYAPVLDDLYLYGEISLRYGSLNYEDKITQEIKQERENVQSEIRKRGHLPYPGDGLGITGGHALVDLDDDGCLELLILENSSFYRHNPIIKSIFAIRNGQLVCVDNGSSELHYTILAANNIFYQCIDWRGAGYANIREFRLEAGMTAFTTIAEAYSALSFSDGGIPTPYWVKIVDGDEINIEEDEFYALLEQCKNPEEPMVLDFVPLHPDAIDPWSIPHSTDEPLPIPIEYPVAYKDAPEAYKPILDALFLLDELMHQEEYEYDSDKVLGTTGFVEYPYPHDSTLGYALADLNGDGSLELLLGTIDGMNESAPNSIFTLKDGQPVWLTSFWSRNRGVVSEDGTIYSIGSGGAAYTYLSSFRLENNADTLTELTDIRSDYSSSEEKPYYFQIIEDSNHYISEQEFDDFLAMYDNPPERMKLTFIPIVL